MNLMPLNCIHTKGQSGRSYVMHILPHKKRLVKNMIPCNRKTISKWANRKMFKVMAGGFASDFSFYIFVFLSVFSNFPKMNS